MPRQDIVTIEPRGTGAGALRCRDLDVGDLVDDGLRGGRIKLVDETERTRLTRYEFVPGVRLSGRWDNESEGLPLRVDGPGRLDGVLRLHQSGDDLAFRVRGGLGGRRVRTRVRIETRVLSIVEGAELARAAAALPWPVRCGPPYRFSSSSWLGSFLPRRLTPRCASGAAAATGSPARG